MRKSLLLFVCICSLLALTSRLAISATAAVPHTPTQESAALELVKKLSLCVNMRMVGVDTECVKYNFFPLLGIGKSDRVLYGQMGVNSDGRWFWFVVKKTSLSGKTTSIFYVTFDFDRVAHVRLGDEAIEKIIFEIHRGALYGTIPANDVGLVSIYDLGRAFYLTEDASGGVATDIGLEINPYYSADSLLQKGKTVEAILEERLTSLEKAGKGGPGYSEEAEWRFGGGVEKDPERRHWIKFYF